MSSNRTERYFVSHKNCEIIIETANPKEKTIMTLLCLLIQELMKINPELWEQFSDHINSLTVEPDDTFEFYENLMQR